TDPVDDGLRADAADFSQVPLGNRHLAYLQWSCQAPLSPADLVIFSDPHLRVSLTARWQQQLDSWLPIPGDLPRDRQDWLLAVRVMGDVVSFYRASGMLEVESYRAAALCLLAEGILEGDELAPVCYCLGRSSPRSSLA